MSPFGRLSESTPPRCKPFVRFWGGRVCLSQSKSLGVAMEVAVLAVSKHVSFGWRAILGNENTWIAMIPAMACLHSIIFDSGNELYLEIVCVLQITMLVYFRLRPDSDEVATGADDFLRQEHKDGHAVQLTRPENRALTTRDVGCGSSTQTAVVTTGAAAASPESSSASCSRSVWWCTRCAVHPL